MSSVGHIRISFKPVLIRNNSNKNRVTLDLHQAKADKPEDQWLKEKKFQHKCYYYRKVAWLKHRCWMLIAVGLIQHLCKSKAISHLLQHLRIRSMASKYSETESSYSCTTSTVCEVPGTSVKAFLIYARVRKRIRPYLLLSECFQGVMMIFGAISPWKHWFRDRLAASKSHYQGTAYEMSGGLRCDQDFHC